MKKRMTKIFAGILCAIMIFNATGAEQFVYAAQEVYEAKKEVDEVSSENFVAGENEEEGTSTGGSGEEDSSTGEEESGTGGSEEEDSGTGEEETSTSENEKEESGTGENATDETRENENGTDETETETEIETDETEIVETEIETEEGETEYVEPQIISYAMEQIERISASSDISQEAIEKLFWEHPEYLKNADFDDVIGETVKYALEVQDQIDNETAATIIEGLHNGSSIIWSEFWDGLGIGEDYETKHKKAMAKEMLQKYCKVDTSLTTCAKEVKENYGTLSKVYDMTVDEGRKLFAEELKTKNVHLTDKEIDKVVNDIFANKEYISNLETVTKETIGIFAISMEYIELLEIEEGMLDDLITICEEANCGEVTDQLKTVREDRKKDFWTYFSNYYLTDHVLETLWDACKDWVKKNAEMEILGSAVDLKNVSSIYSTANLLIGIMADVYEDSEPSVDEIIFSAMALSYFNSADRIVNNYRTKFRLAKAGNGTVTNEDIRKYEAAYTFELVVTQILAKYSWKIAYKQDQNSELHFNMLFAKNAVDKFTYKKYLSSCIKNMEADNIEIPELPDNYDSTESIALKFAEIQKQYVPNASYWTGSWGGCIQCFGFARMVFSKLFGCEMSSAYYGNRRYELVPSDNMVTVGQLVGSDVSSTNVKNLLTQGKLGDIIQANGVYGQHTMILEGTSDAGVTVYQCNRSGECGVYEDTYSWDTFAGMYGSATNGSANGITLYRAYNYASIYGDGTNLFYDDSVNFVIDKNGVLTKYKGYQKFVKIPDTVTSIGSSAFKGNTTMLSVHIPDTVTTIGDSAFYGCTSLMGVFLPEGVTSIESSAFSSCSALREVVFPSSLVTIGGSSFFGTALETIDISDNVTKIGCAAFGNCKKLEKVDLPKHLQYLEGNTFINCVSLKSIEIPKSLQSASGNWIGGVSNSGSGEFRGCTSLKEISFEEGTTKVAQMLFYCAPAIETITIPKGVTLIEKEAFCYCTSLREIVLENAGNLKEIQNSAFRGTAITEIEIPNVTNFGNYVFAECSELRKVAIPRTWIRLMQGSFYQCGKLDTVVMSPQMQEIRQEAFSGCKNLENIEFPDTLLTVRDSAFYNCDSLTSLSLPSGMTTIEQKAFYDCDGLLDVTVPDSVTSMGDYAFYHCNSLKDVSLGTGITVIPQYAFANCGKIEEITLPYRVTTISAYAFNTDTSLTKIRIPRNVTSIATTAFSYPDKMTIYGISGTYAETFADANGYAFVNNEIPADKITVTPQELTVNKGYYKRLSLQVAPSNFTDKVTFKSANTDIATVDADGKVTGVSVGSTTVKVIVGSLSKSIKVTVNQPVTGIYVYPYSKEMEAGEELELEIDVYPDTATNKAYQLKSSDSTVASVSEDGVVKALKKGTARITATALDGSGKSDYCDITVLNNLYQVQGTEGFESTHPYGDNCKDIWEYQNPEAEKIRITFSKDTEVEEDFDFIRIYGPEKKLIGTYTGTSLAGKSIEVEGSVVYVQLVSDDAGSVYGFKVTEICVNSQEIPVKAISLDTTQLTLAKGEHRTLTVKYTPENTTADRTVIWSSSNEAVAGVDKNGVVTALSAGTAVITAKVGKLSAKAAVTVTAAMTGIAFEKTELTLLLGDSYALTASPVPADTTDDAGVTYQSSAPDIVSVDENGILFARKKGNAVITATSVFKPEYTADCEVTVSCNTITFDSQGGSKIEPLECSSGAGLVLSDKVPEREGYQFTGWYKDSTCTLAWDEATDMVTEDITLYAGWQKIQEDFWVIDIPAQTYTGKAIKPQVVAYDGDRLLVQKKDYSVSYKNNVNVYEGDEETKKPQVIVKGLGNYTGTKIITFDICPKSLSDEDIQIADIYKVVNGKEQKTYPTVMWGKKKLTYNKNEAKSNYLLTYPEGDYIHAGEHEVTVTGRGNYCGQTNFKLILTDGKLISKASVKYQKNLVWQNGEPVEQTGLVVKMGSKTLLEGTDYSVSYENNSEIGTAVLLLRGLGDYAGEKRITYNITGQKLSKAKISGIVNKEYTGEPIYQQYSIACGGESLVLHEDYEVVYQKNVSVGTASMIFTGIGGYTGTVKKTFRITPYSVKTNEIGAFEDQSGVIEAVYEKGGVKPSVSLTFHGKALNEGEDYTLSYKNNGAVNDGMNLNRLPTITIKGKGNFKDSISRTFTIVAADISAEGSRMQAEDVVFKNKKNAYKTKPVIYDAFGKKLVAGKDYDKNLIFRYDDAQGALIGASEIPQTGSVIYVEAQGINNYAGSCIGTTYRIAGKSIKSAKVTVNAQTYTGNPVVITKDDITKIVIGKEILSQEDYEILEGTYVNNIKKGTAKVTIRGLGDYGCEKQITFKIVAKSIK